MGIDKNRESWRENKTNGGGIFAKSFISTPIFKTLGRELIDSELVESRKKTGIFVNMSLFDTVIFDDVL